MPLQEIFYIQLILYFVWIFIGNLWRMIEVLSIRIYSLVYFCGLRSIMTGLFKTPSNLFSSQLDLLIHPFALQSQPIKCKWKCSTSRTVHDFPVTFVTSFAPAENYPVRKEPSKYFIYQILSLKHCSIFICISYRVPRPQVFTWSAHNYDKGAGFAGPKGCRRPGALNTKKNKIK